MGDILGDILGVILGDIYSFFYLLTDKLRITLGISYTHNAIIVGYAEYQATAYAIGKSTYTFQPALHLAAFHFLFFIVFRGLANVSFDVHSLS